MTVSSLKKVGILGPLLTYTHQAALKHYGDSVDIVPLESIDAVIAAVERNAVDEGVVPEENKIRKAIADTYAGLWNYNVTVIGKVVLPIQNCLGVVDGSVSPANILEVVTKADAYAQCEKWLGEHAPDAKLTAWPSTAGAVQEVKQRGFPWKAAIGPELAIAHYGLVLAARGIDDRPDNATIFSAIAPGREILTKPTPSANGSLDETWILMVPSENKPGELYNVLGALHSHGVDMTKIQSLDDLPMKLPGQYMFEVRVRGHASQPNIRQALGDLRKRCGDENIQLKVVGSYRQVRLGEAQNL